MADQPKKESKFRGFEYADPEKNERDPKSGQRGAKRAFETDIEGMRSDYEKYRSKNDPTVDEIASRLGAGDEEAYDIMRNAHQKADETRKKEWSRVNEMGPLRRRIYDVTGFKKGGSVKSSASKRADGCATKGKTRGRMV